MPVPTEKSGASATHVVLTVVVLVALIMATLFGLYVSTMFDGFSITSTPDAGAGAGRARR